MNNPSQDADQSNNRCQTNLKKNCGYGLYFLITMTIIVFTGIYWGAYIKAKNTLNGEECEDCHCDTNQKRNPVIIAICSNSTSAEAIDDCGAACNDENATLRFGVVLTLTLVTLISIPLIPKIRALYRNHFGIFEIDETTSLLHPLDMVAPEHDSHQRGFELDSPSR